MSQKFVSSLRRNSYIDFVKEAKDALDAEYKRQLDECEELLIRNGHIAPLVAAPKSTVTESETPPAALNTTKDAKTNITYSRLFKAQQALKTATAAFQTAKGPERSKAMVAFEKAKKDHMRAKADHEAATKVGKDVEEK